MEKKYTMNEFEEMFLEAQARAIESLDKKMKTARKEMGKENESMSDFAFSLQNMMAMSQLHGELFRK